MSDKNQNTGTFHQAFIIFLLIWGIYGSIVNLWDQYGYNLMHSGVEALSERGVFYLEGSDTPKFEQLGKIKPEAGRDSSSDVFWNNGHLYPMKHPGMFFVGSLIYKPLTIFGLRYALNYNIVTSLISWLSCGLLGSIVIMLLFLQARGEGLGKKSAIIVVLSLAIGSIFFPYSGILHHDFLGACFLYFAYYISFNPEAKNDRRFWRFIMTGIFAGFSFTCSPLAAFYFLPFALALGWQKGWKNILNFTAGYILGILPLLIYCGACFGNPFMLPNSAANEKYTIFLFSFPLIIQNFHHYFISSRTSVWVFMPVFYFAIAGLILRIKEKNKDTIILFAGSGMLVFYILGIDTHGGATFGPRYLIPALPFLAIGLIHIMKLIESRYENNEAWKKALWIIFGICFSIGIFINFSGAVKGTMYGMEGHPFIHRLKVAIGLRGINETPGAFPLLYPIIFISSLIYYFFPKKSVKKNIFGSDD
jgi:dolichyl-phosphate-mannose-protein mannosyltransferase